MLNSPLKESENITSTFLRARHGSHEGCSKNVVEVIFSPTLNSETWKSTLGEYNLRKGRWPTLRMKVWIIALSSILLVEMMITAFFLLNMPKAIIITPGAANVSQEKPTADSRSEAATGTAKEMQAPEPIEGVNLALNKAVTADAHTQSYYAANAADGNVNTYWEGAGNAYPNRLTVDLGDISSIKIIRIKLNPESQWVKRTQVFSIQGSMDDKQYNTLVEAAEYVFDPAASNCVTIKFNEVKTKYVRLEFKENTGAAAGQAAEVEVY